MGSWPADRFPVLNDKNHVVTSCKTKIYNCIAWAMGENDRKWWPIEGDYYWPTDDRTPTVATFERAFELRGFKRCPNGDWEPGVEKVVIYTKGSGRKMEVTHAARQLGPNKWTSKMGDLEDITHDSPQNLRGPGYGKPYAYYGRTVKGTPSDAPSEA